ncbi:MAG: thiolase family protein [Dethiobacteria bacterium]
MRDVVIVGAARTPIGDFGGALRTVTAYELAVTAVNGALQRAGISKEAVDEVILGNCLQRSDEANIARYVAMLCGMLKETTGFTVQRQCSSGMQAVISAYQEIVLGDAEIVVAGGTESMSNAPYLLKEARWGKRLQHGQMSDSIWDVLTDPVPGIIMGETAENLAEKYGITREEQDEIALRSHQNAVAAIKEGRFVEEIVEVKVEGRKGVNTVTTDEHPRADISLERLSQLKAVFRKGGTVTAGNSSSLNDGAAAVVLMSAEKAKDLGIEPLAKISSYAWAGVEPELMGYGPVPATKKALAKAGIRLEDIQLIELNEAFAAQYLACEKLLGLDRNIVNVNGSGISLGHPIGCTGTRIIVSLIYEMKRRNLNLGLATLCIGGGMGMAMVLERE